MESRDLALIHDLGREHDHHDPEHGIRAAAIAARHTELLSGAYQRSLV